MPSKSFSTYQCCFSLMFRLLLQFQFNQATDSNCQFIVVVLITKSKKGQYWYFQFQLTKTTLQPTIPYSQGQVSSNKLSYRVQFIEGGYTNVYMCIYMYVTVYNTQECNYWGLTVKSSLKCMQSLYKCYSGRHSIEIQHEGQLCKKKTNNISTVVKVDTK